MNYFYSKLTLLVLGVSFLFPGCGSKNHEVKKKPELPQIQQIDFTQLQEKIRINNGKITVVNFWASWCLPCKEEMPFLVKLKKNYKDNLELLIVAIDDPDSIDAVLRPILTQNGVDFSTYIKQEGNDEVFINSINPEWSGALPATFIFNSEGKQVEMLVGGQTLEKFEKAIGKCLEK